MTSGETIEQLNYEVILDDTNFNQKITDLLHKAQDFNDKMSEILNLKNISGAGLNGVQSSVEKIVASTDKLGQSQKSYNAQVKESNTALNGTVNVMQMLTRLTGIAFGVEGVRRFFSSLVDVTGQFEVQKMALTSMLQDADRADEIFNTLRQNALKSPYTFQDLTKYAKQLTAFNIDADKLVETENRLADVAAGLGVDMGRIILAYGQVKAAGVLKGTELRQFTEAGVPLLQSLAEQIKETEGKAISLSEVFQRISKKQIPFEMVEEAFRRMTDEGGKFYNMQEVLVNTLQGKIGKLRDVWQQALYDIGNANDSWLKGGVDALTWFASNLEKIGFALKPIIVGFGAYAAVLAIVALRQKVVAAASFIKALHAIATGAYTASGAMAAFGVSASAAAIAIGAVVAAGALLYLFFKNINDPIKKFRKELDEIHKTARDTSSYDAEISRLESLRKTLNNSNNSYEERKRALDQIKSIVPSYHADLTTEGKLINDNKVALDEYIASMQREAKLAGARKELEELYSKRRDVNRQLIESWKNEQNQPQRIGTGLFGATLYDNGTTDAYGDPVAAAVANTHNLSVQLGEVDGRIKDIEKEILAVGIAVDTVSPVWTPGGDIDRTKDALNDLKANISILERYRDAYEKLEPYFGLETSAKMAEIFGGDASSYVDIDRQILALTEDLRLMGEEGAKAADEIMVRLGLDKLSQVVKAEKAAEAWRKELEKWEKDFGGTKTGTEGRVEKAIAEFENKAKEIDRNAEEAAKKLLAAYGGDPAKYIEELNKLMASVDNAHASNARNFKDDVAGLAKYIFGDQTGHLDLTNWGDKTITQIYHIQQELKKVKVPPEIEELFEGEEGQGALQSLVEALQKLVNDESSKASEEFWDELFKGISKVAGIVSKFGDSLRNLGDATGDLKLAALGEDISEIGRGVAGVAEGFASDGWIGAAIAAVSWLANGFVSAKDAAAQFENQLASLREEARRAQYADMLGFGVNSIFGTNDMQKVSNAVSVMKKAQAAMSMNKAPGVFNGKKDFWDYFWNGGARTFTTTLAEMANAVGGELYDAYGNLNANTLQTILDTYKGLGTEEQRWIQQAIDDSEAYADAMEQLEDVVTSVFDKTVDSAADKIVDSWWQAGSAALDYADILDDVAKSYAKLLVKQILFDTAFDNTTKDALQKAFAAGDSEGAMSIVARAMEAATAVLPVAEKTLEAFEPYINRNGTSEDNSLKNGINKELIEGNSSLLASYINAMRADLSVLRAFQSNGWQDVAAIRVAVPTIMEYTANIEAHTFATAQSSSEILRRIQSVITPSSSGGSAVRTTK